MGNSCLTALLFASLLAAAPEPPPPFGLSDDAVPRHYSVELTVDPDRDAFDGVVRIDIDLRKRMPAIWLNSAGLTISETDLQINGHFAPIRATVHDGEVLGIEMETPAGPGRAVLTLRYKAPLADKAIIGPYRLLFEDHSYVFTTFTPNGARHAFPCFDQPRFKTPWEFAIRVKRDQQAFTNSKTARETEEPAGMKRVEFTATEPLASEVVAFAVGPLDTLEGGAYGRRDTPVRIVSPRGHAAEGGEAARASRDLLWRLERYTGISYPYDKLDHVALPNLPFGAVENVGLITYRMRSLLFPPGKTTVAQERSVRSIEAHEMAHQWFGDFVTQAVWEDVWLSEGFATWLSAKIMDEDQPAARRRLAAVAARDRIMIVDESPKTRPVRLAMRDLEALKDVYNRFVYQKGAAIMDMMEGWLGEDNVRNGLHVYLSDHRFGNVTTGDLAAALRLASQIDPSDVMHDFLDHTGVPVMKYDVRCDPGILHRIVFEQTNTSTHWDVPVCWKTDAASGCTVVDGRKQYELPPAAACPAWVYLNAQGTGYYRTEWDATQLAAIANRALGRLNAAERLTLATDIAELRRKGRLDAAAAEPALKKLAADVEPEISAVAKKALE